ncbi:MAG: hypothetical protein HJJLKODD_00001 [Phycisphaerae bacterium]|nr:hypothetical protein [Phycisphaerae bacterium]
MPYSAGLKQINLYFNRQVSNVSTTYGETFTLYDYCGNALSAPTGWTVTNSSSTPPFKVTLSWTTGYTNQAVRVGIKGSGAFQLVDYQAAALDGEISDLDSGTLPSGNNTAGGDANFRLYALTGDTDGDQDADQTDYNRLNACYGAASSCCVPCDLAGGGTIGLGDLSEMLTAKADYWVDTTADENDGSCSDGDCSLRDTLNLVSNSKTIKFDIGTFAACNTPTITLSSELPELDNTSMTLDGSNPAVDVIIDGNNLAAGEHGLTITGDYAVYGITLNNFNADVNTYGIYVTGYGIIGGVTAGQGNTITGGQGPGIVIDNTLNVPARGNLIYSNGRNPIALLNGANEDRLEPVPYCTTTTTISGSAYPEASVDVYSNNDTDLDCEAYLGSTTADSNGNWSLTYSSPQTVDHRVVAIQTDEDANTSEVSSNVVVRDTCSSGIWDDGSAGFSTTLANGDGIDSMYSDSASLGLVAMDSSDNLYVLSDPGLVLYLSRYNNSTMTLYDQDSTFGSVWAPNEVGALYADPVDNQSFSGVYGSTQYLAVDSTGKVYWSFIQNDGSANRTYLNRYNGTAVETWAGSWNTDLTSPTAIDRWSATSCTKTVMAIDGQNRVYVAFLQNDGTASRLYLTRYDGTDVRIWDNDTSSWTTTFTNGDPIDNGNAVATNNMVMAVDGADRVYVAFTQIYSSRNRLFLTRYDGSDVKIWDNGASTWTDTFTNGDPIDNGQSKAASINEMLVDGQDRVYIPFRQSDASNIIHMYLTRYDGSDVKIWDNGTSSWTDTFTNGDPIDNNSTNFAYLASAGVDSQDRVYVSFLQGDGFSNRLFLSRYDGSDVKIWDNGTSSWTDTFSNGDPIDHSDNYDVTEAQLAIDSQDRVYMAFVHDNGAANQLFLVRYDGQDVKIFDRSGTTWTDTFGNGDPLDLSNGNNALKPKIIINSDDRVFLTFVQGSLADSNEHVHIARY